MIVKRISNPKKSTSKSNRITGLLKYIWEYRKEQNRQVKCEYSGARGFHTTHPKSQAAEMIALSLQAVRSKDPVSHYVMSWQKGEIPSHGQIDQAVDIFLKQMGLENHQTIYALHVDTDNRHLHIVVNRVHPLSMKPVEINGGFDKEAAHQAIAWIEYLQGWRSEKRRRYFFDQSGVLCASSTSTRRNDQFGSHQNDMEIRTGKISAQRTILARSGAIFTRSENWQELHINLAKEGMVYEKVGGGAILRLGDIGVKASKCGPLAKLFDLEGRFGPYEVPLQTDRAPVRGPARINLEIEARARYSEGLTANRLKRVEQLEDLRKLQKSQRIRLNEIQRSRRNKVLNLNDWKGQGVAKSAMRMVLAKEQEQENGRLKRIQKRVRKETAEKLLPWPTFEDWQLNAAPDKKSLPVPAALSQPQFDEEQSAPALGENAGTEEIDEPDDEHDVRDKWPRES